MSTDRDSQIAPSVTITENPDGTFDVVESAVTHTTTLTYEQAVNDAQAIFGEDVAINSVSPDPSVASPVVAEPVPVVSPPVVPTTPA